MNNEENERISEENTKNQNSNSKEKINQNKEKDYKSKTGKSFYILPSVQKTNKESFRSSLDFNNKRKIPIINQQDYDQNLLKKELSLYKCDMHNKKNDLLKLKIKYSKLNYENASNKNLIFTILGIPSDFLLIYLSHFHKNQIFLPFFVNFSRVPFVFPLLFYNHFLNHL